jgi:polar amino acid transport system substrate-binding protein
MQQWLCRIFLLVVCLVSVAALAAPPLRVGTAADLPPVIYRAEGEQGLEVVGIEADFARVLASQLGRPLQWRVLPRDELLGALARGEVDIVMSGLPVGSGAAEFTRPYLRSGLMALIRTVDVMRFRSPAALLQGGGYRVGFVEGGSAAAWVGEQLQGVEPVALPGTEAALQALLDGRIDVLVEPAATSWRIATEPRYGDLMSLNRLLTEERLGWALPPGDSAFRARVEQELERMRQTGVLTHILDRWIPVAPE